MADLIEFLLDVLLSGLDFWELWRFLLPLLGSLALVGLICWLVPIGGARIVISAPVLLAGIASGVCWQARRG